MSTAATSYTAAGPTYVMSPGATSTSTVITALVPVRSLLIVNGNNKPIAFTIGINSATVTAVVPTAGNPQQVDVVNHDSTAIMDIPVRLASQVAGLGGFTTTVTIACIETASGTGNCYITPIL
jgi:hypothetical protein